MIVFVGLFLVILRSEMMIEVEKYQLINDNLAINMFKSHITSLYKLNEHQLTLGCCRRLVAWRFALSASVGWPILE